MLDLQGKKFGRLTVVRLDGLHKRNFWWICRCECGKEKSVRTNRLTLGTTRSCGCLRHEMNIAFGKKFGPLTRTHGGTVGRKWTREYVTWYAMRQRVTNKRHEHYRYYGGRGIRICTRWRKFENFLADMGPRPPGKTLDRRNNNGNYTPKNCRWATPLEQAQSKRKRGMA